MVARVVPQSARRRHAESRKPDLRGVVAGGRWPVLTVCRDQRTTLGLLVPWCDSSVQQARLPLLDRISTKQHGRGAHLPLRFVDSVRHTTRSYRLQQQSSSAI